MADLPYRFGKFLLLRRVAVGGMAEIFLAVEKSAHGGRRFVTIKRIRHDFDHDDEYVEFFLTEGRVSLKCAHPNLPQAYDMGVVEGCHYLALEYIHGHTLLDVVRAAALGKRPLSVASAVHVGVGVAAALEHAHGLRDVDGRPLSVVHRDVTPQNVMLSVSGAVKLIDFGIVRSAVQTHRTESGVVKGKFSYMAPESLTGRGVLDHRADLFALGIVLHETLTGRSLFRGHSDHDTLDRVRSLVVPDLTLMRPDVPHELSAVVLKALERDPDRRFQTATEMLSALEQAAEECHVHHSMTRLRDEVLDRCGYPPVPSLGPQAVALLRAMPGHSPRLGTGADHEALREPPTRALRDPAATALSEPPTVAMSEPPTLATEPPTQAAPTTTAFGGDAQLAYFLRRAGALPGGTGEVGEADAAEPADPGAPVDPELAALLAALEH